MNAYDMRTIFITLGMEIVQVKEPETEYGSNPGSLVVGKDDKFYRLDYHVDSYGDNMSMGSFKEVFPKEVTSVEYS